MLRVGRGVGWFALVLGVVACGAIAGLGQEQQAQETGGAKGTAPAVTLPVAASGPVAANDVTWTSPGRDENDSMPIGNGDFAANVWTEQNGDLVLLLAKADAWTEMGQLVKLGRVRVHLAPNPFTGPGFEQTLHLEDGSIEIVHGGNRMRVWIHATSPVLHIESHTAQPTTIRASLELWRTRTRPYNEPSPHKGGFFEFGNHAVPLDFEADTVLPAGTNALSWYHWNQASIYPLVLEQEHLASLRDKYPDPLLHRCFGATLTGAGFVAGNDRTLTSAAPAADQRLDVIALTAPQVTSPQLWQAGMSELTQRMAHLGPDGGRAVHEAWWREFWDRSWIHLSGTPQAEAVSQGYAMQRYMMAASSRGAYPAKFNGGLFTVGHDLPENAESTPKNHNPDFRAWGDSYWNQNNRLLYWPLIATGDFDLLEPWFAMYRKALPLAEDRTRLYFHHDGASFIETMYFWGLPNLNDFGWDNATDEVESHWMRYHVQGTLEVIAQMLDEYDVTGNAEFALHDLVPFADAIVTYYDQHWPRGSDGKIHMTPVQSLETYQLDAVNPTPDVAGLKSILPRLLALPEGLTTEKERAAWSKVLQDLPPIATGTTAKGKLPPLGKGDVNGKAVILPAERYGKTSNMENPELYTAFPYRLYGVTKPDLTLARNTYAARLFPQDVCWGQDGPQAAVLGLTSEAQKAAVAEFTDYGDERFRWFWKAGHDWIPDLDNGGTGMMTLQLMLMQTDGKKILLLPAWPKEWAADFKLHAPRLTVVEGHVEGGKITRLEVTPRPRANDVTTLDVTTLTGAPAQ